MNDERVDNTPTIYIAGPMRGIPYFNHPAFHDAEIELRRIGWPKVINPAVEDMTAGFDAMGLPDDTDWTDPSKLGFSMADAIRRSVDAVMRADAIYMLRGWQESTGARTEHAIAKWRGIEIRYQEEAEPVEQPRHTECACDGECVAGSVGDNRSTVGACDGGRGSGCGSAAAESTMADDADILDIAARITRGDRQATYGPPDQDFRRTAAMWSALKGVTFEPWEVAQFMIALKLSRETHQRKRDNAVDIAGYARCLDVCNRAAGVY